jgi:hypothetical protein
MKKQKRYSREMLDIIESDCIADLRPVLCPLSAIAGGYRLCAGNACAWFHPEAQNCAIFLMIPPSWDCERPAPPPIPHLGTLPVALAAALAAKDPELTADDIIQRRVPPNQQPEGPFDSIQEDEKGKQGKNSSEPNHSPEASAKPMLASDTEKILLNVRDMAREAAQIMNGRDDDASE